MSIATERLDESPKPNPTVGSQHFERRRWTRRNDASASARTSGALAVPIREGRLRATPVVHRRILAAADVLAAGVALALAAGLTGDRFDPVVLVAAPFIVLANKAGGLYERDAIVLRKTTLDDAPSLLQITGLFSLTVWLIHGAVTTMTLGPSQVIVMWIATLLLALVGRALVRATACRLGPKERCMVIGDSRSVAALAGKLADNRSANAEIVAQLTLRAEAPAVEMLTFHETILRERIERVIIAPISTDAADMLDVIRAAKALGLRVSVLPRLLEAVGTAVEFDEIGGLTMLGVRHARLSRSSRLVKRAFDLVGSTVALVACAPVIPLVALAIRLDSPGPIFFRQTRVGRGGERFEILKFRSMVCDAERRKEELVHLNETVGLFKISEDPRVTRVGRVLRRWCIDELPQLVNVWRGEMSLVGPRPLVVDEDAKIVGLDRSRLHLTPGMTGHWQVLGSSRIPMEEMIAIDYLYVANWSLWTDFKLLLRTLPMVMSGSGV